eukprot:6209969-Prymnesium_polylepis.1
MRELQGALAGKPLGADNLGAAPRRSSCGLGCVDGCMLDYSEAYKAFQRAGGDLPAWRALTERKDSFAQQTLAVFVPLAQRLGMWVFKTELEALAFAILHPAESASLSRTLDT